MAHESRVIGGEYNPIVKKMAEAVKGNETQLVTLWSDQVLTECKPVDIQDGQPNRELECQELRLNPKTEAMAVIFDEPAVRFFDRLGQLERQGYHVKVLYDSEGAGFSGVESMMTG
jgi:hypothetical protein